MPTLPLDEWIKLLGAFYDRYGYLTVFLGTLGENTALLGLLLPGNSLALLGAMYARLGSLNLAWVIVLASLGTVFGYHIDYLFGRIVLVRVAARWSASTFGQRIRLSGRLRLASRLIAKHGGKAILISHLVGQLRSFVALSAGMTGMRYWRFLGYELVAASAWNAAFCTLGYLLSSEVARLQTLIERGGWLLLGLLALLLLAWRIFGRRAKRRRRGAHSRGRARLHEKRQTMMNANKK
jgi:membrane protein DedA with SNARE-associated domain